MADTQTNYGLAQWFKPVINNEIAEWSNAVNNARNATLEARLAALEQAGIPSNPQQTPASAGGGTSSGSNSSNTIVETNTPAKPWVPSHYEDIIKAARQNSTGIRQDPYEQSNSVYPPIPASTVNNTNIPANSAGFVLTEKPFESWELQNTVPTNISPVEQAVMRDNDIAAQRKTLYQNAINAKTGREKDYWYRKYKEFEKDQMTKSIKAAVRNQ